MIDFWHDWSGVLRPSAYNWVDFTLIRLECERDGMLGNFSVAAALFGFHARLTWQVGGGDADLRDRLSKVIDDIESGEARISIPLAEYEALRAASPISGHVACQSGEVVE